jgi:hypothetical protein
VSCSITTVGSIQVEAGSTIVQPASRWPRLMRSRRIAAASASSTRVLTPSVSAGSDVHRHLVACLDDRAHRVGEVQLALRVVAVEALDRGPQQLGLEDVDRRVRLGEGEDLGGRIDRLDDCLEQASIVAYDAAVAADVGRDEREDGAARALGAMVGHELGQQLGGEQRGVARQDEDATRPALQRGARRRDRVAGAARCLLHCELEPRELVLRVGRDDDHERVGAERTGRLDDPVDHPAAQDRVQVLRRRRLHAGADATRHHDGCEVGDGGHGIGRRRRVEDGWGARIRTWDGGTKTRCLTTWPRPIAARRV